MSSFQGKSSTRLTSFRNPKFDTISNEVDKEFQTISSMQYPDLYYLVNYKPKDKLECLVSKIKESFLHNLLFGNNTGILIKDEIEIRFYHSFKTKFMLLFHCYDISTSEENINHVLKIKGSEMKLDISNAFVH